MIDINENGFKETWENIRRIREELKKQMPNILGKAAFITVAKAKETAPWKTGNLRRSIHRTEPVGVWNELYTQVGSPVDYAYIMEVVRPSKKAPNGYLYVSLVNTFPRVEAYIQNRINEIFEEKKVA